MTEPYTIFPLGDAAATIDLGNEINATMNDKVLAMQEWLKVHPIPGQLDLVIAYSSLTVIYNPYLVSRLLKVKTTAFELVKEKLKAAYDCSEVNTDTLRKLVHLPVCYDGDFAPDLPALAGLHGLQVQDVIDIHLARSYRVYALGFLPGFSYMAEVDQRIATARKREPEPVEAGSVGIAGAQTGIYSLNSPGGWHIIGRTPVKQFDANGEKLTYLAVGDEVQFYRINREEFESCSPG